MRLATDPAVVAPRLGRRARQLACVLLVVLAAAWLPQALAAPACSKPVYLTFDTGHMAVAPLVAEVLNRHAVKVTFFLANERTKDGGSSLDDRWAPWWKARASEGHAFGSHSWNHDVLKGEAGGRFRLVPTAGERAGQAHELDAAAYCRELARPARRLVEMTGQPMSAIFRAPGGKTSAALLAAAKACGWAHVGWSDAGFLGDELPSDRYPNARLLAQSLNSIRTGDILLAHLGIWSRQDPWAPAVLEPLIVGLKSQGFCFETLREHPSLGDAARRAAPSP
jgi:peptidoglycan/xylan/chitin deacetylase (PgdA/CDA1 family)